MQLDSNLKVPLSHLHQMVFTKPSCSPLTSADSNSRTLSQPAEPMLKVEEETEEIPRGCLCWRGRVAGMINCDLLLILATCLMAVLSATAQGV